MRSILSKNRFLKGFSLRNPLPHKHFLNSECFVILFYAGNVLTKEMHARKLSFTFHLNAKDEYPNLTKLCFKM